MTYVSPLLNKQSRIDSAVIICPRLQPAVGHGVCIHARNQAEIPEMSIIELRYTTAIVNLWLNENVWYSPERLLASAIQTSKIYSDNNFSVMLNGVTDRRESGSLLELSHSRQ